MRPGKVERGSLGFWRGWDRRRGGERQVRRGGGWELEVDRKVEEPEFLEAQSAERLQVLVQVIGGIGVILSDGVC